MRKISSAVICALAAFLVLAAVPSIARADSIYSDFGAGSSFNLYTGWTLNSSQTGVGAAFTPGANFTLSQIDIALANVYGTNMGIVELVNDAGGLPGSTVLESWTLGPLPAFASNFTPDALTSASNPTLLAGTQYWVVAMPPDSTTLDVWNYNTQGHTGLAYFPAGGTWQHDSGATPAFDVLGTPLAATPEPGTALMLGIGLLGLLGFARLRKTIPHS